MKVKVNVASEAAAKRMFMAWANEVEDVASNILYVSTDEEDKELLTACEGTSEWDYVVYTCEYLPSLRNRIAAEMAAHF